MRLGLMTSEGLISGGRTVRIDENAIIDALDGLKDSDVPRVDRVEIVKSYLHHASSNMIRNHAALALVDLIAEEAAGDIIEVLRSRNIAHESGSLLFALNEVNADFPLDILVRTALDGSYEARNEAIFALNQDHIAPFDDEMELRSLDAVSHLLDSGDAERVEIADRLISAISAKKQNVGAGPR